MILPLQLRTCYYCKRGGQLISSPVKPARQTVLFVSLSLTGGGMERVLLTLLRHLDRTQFELHLALLQVKGEFLGEVPKDVVLHDLRSSRLRYALPGLLRLIWKLRPSVVMATLAYVNLGLILLRPLLPRKTRLIVREATVLRCNLREEMQRPGLWEWLYRHLYKRADRVVCQSDWMFREFVENFNLPPDKLVRIYNPVDIRRVRQWAEIGGNPFSGDGPHLVAAGRLFPVKGFDILLEAMPAVMRRFPGVQLTILGDGPLMDDLAVQAHTLGISGNVHFIGFQQNPWPYIRHAQAFVLASRHETLSNAMLEALALGTPVIAADCPGGVREIQALSTGMVMVPPEDPQSLAQAIIAVCAEPKPRREYQPAKFALQPALGQYSELLLS